MNQKEIVTDIFKYSEDFKKNALWEKLIDSEYFGLKFPDGQVGFVRIIGTEHQKALNLYLGEKSLDRIRNLYLRDYTNPFYDFENIHLKQDYIQISFDPLELVSKEIAESYENYCKEHNIAIDDYVNLLRYQPYYYPTMITNNKELEYLRLALIAQNEVNEALIKNNKKELGFKSVYPGEPTQIPLLNIQDESNITWDFIETPGILKEEPLELVISKENDEILEKVKNLEETFEDTVFLHYIDELVPDKKGKLKYPAYLLVLPSYGLNLYFDSSLEEQLPPIDVMLDLDEKTLEKELMELAQFYIDQKAKPKAIRTVDLRTFNLLKDFCQKTGITLKNGEKGSISWSYYNQINSDILFDRLQEILIDLEPGKPIQDLEKMAQREKELKKVYEEFLKAIENGEFS